MIKMKRLSTALLALALPSFAQAPPPSCDGSEWRQFDFWLGEWKLAYGKGLESRNRITSILGGCAILEEFSGSPGTKLEGRSFSVFDREARRWKQTWVDNNGSYLDFTGGWADGRMVLSRTARRGGETFLQRMVWQDITPDRLKWLWQRSDDQGGTWKTLWEIDYTRAR